MQVVVNIELALSAPPLQRQPRSQSHLGAKVPSTCACLPVPQVDEWIAACFMFLRRRDSERMKDDGGAFVLFHDQRLGLGNVCGEDCGEDGWRPTDQRVELLLTVWQGG